MRFTALITLTILFVSCVQEKSDLFLNKILKDFNSNSYFVILKTRTDGNSYLSLVENDDLLHFFQLNKGFSEEDYKNYMLRFLKQNETLNLSKNDFKKFGFSSIKGSEDIDEIAKNGKDFFIKTFFKGRVLVKSISDENMNYIIKKLYDWEVAAKIDDETGYLLIYNINP